MAANPELSRASGVTDKDMTKLLIVRWSWRGNLALKHFTGVGILQETMAPMSMPMAGLKDAYELLAPIIDTDVA
jgi:hypothetical protein